MQRPASVLVMFALVSALPSHAADLVAQSGKELYGRFCASCHGPEGNGDGPVASFFKEEVPDLTMIAQRHGGKYPYALIERVIDGRHVIGAHGTRTMPVWGEELARTERGNPEAEEVSRTIIGRIADHLWSIQRPLDQGTSDSPHARPCGVNQRFPKQMRRGPENVDPLPPQK